MHRPNGTDMLADALIGAAAGAAAVWVMDRLDWFNFEHEAPEARRTTQSVRPGGMSPDHVIADGVAAKVGYDLEPKDYNAAGLAAHYVIGILPGALYGALRRKAPALTVGRGSLFGFALFLLQDEALNAATGLSAKPQRYLWQAHARGLAAHLVYGVALESLLKMADLADGALADGSDRYPAAQRSLADVAYAVGR